MAFAEDFDRPELDRSVWLPHYLPAWSSRAETAATYEIRDSCLRLSIPPTQGPWPPEPPLRVSGVQTGNFSGPVGSPVGQQPPPGGAVVREAQERFEGFLPRYGRLEMRARGVVTPRSMVAWWLVGVEDAPERCAEICVFEVFGDAVEPGRSAAVGMGLHAFRDPATPGGLRRAPAADRRRRLPHVRGGLDAAAATFLVDGAAVRSCPRPPAYPMQLMVAVFDFPDRSTGADVDAVPELIVDWVRST